MLYATLTAVAGIATVTATVGRLELLLLLPPATIRRYVRCRLAPHLLGLIEDTPPVLIGSAAALTAVTVLTGQIIRYADTAGAGGRT